MFERRYPIEAGRQSQVDVTMVGCGGTGSFLALHLARMAYHAREQRGMAIALTFIDPDTVEPKNLGRQNFCPAEVGRNKARALMERYNRAFGLDIRAWAMPFEDVPHPDPKRETTMVLAGCVDNAAARRTMQRAVRVCNGKLWWLDGGNHEQAGQVLLGNRVDLSAPEVLPLGMCGAVPSPGTQHPELLEAPTKTTGELSCADLAAAEIQGLMVNQAVAGWMAVYLSRLLLTHDLDSYATYFDLVAGSARSIGIVRSE